MELWLACQFCPCLSWSKGRDRHCHVTVLGYDTNLDVMCAAPAVAESFAFAKSSGQAMAIAMATATASSRAASDNRQAAAAAFAATAVSSVEQGVVKTFAKSQVKPFAVPQAAACPCAVAQTSTLAAFIGRAVHCAALPELYGMRCFGGVDPAGSWISALTVTHDWVLKSTLPSTELGCPSGSNCRQPARAIVLASLRLEHSEWSPQKISKFPYLPSLLLPTGSSLCGVWS